MSGLPPRARRNTRSPCWTAASSSTSCAPWPRWACEITVYPSHTPAETILATNPDGIFLSPGPGDPALLGDIVQTVRVLSHAKPTMGICLGNQIARLRLRRAYVQAAVRPSRLEPSRQRSGNGPGRDHLSKPRLRPGRRRLRRSRCGGLADQLERRHGGRPAASRRCRSFPSSTTRKPPPAPPTARAISPAFCR